MPVSPEMRLAYDPLLLQHPDMPGLVLKVGGKIRTGGVGMLDFESDDLH